MLASNVAFLALLVLLFPLAAFVVQIFFGRRLSGGGDWISIGAILTSLVGSAFIARAAWIAHDPHWQDRTVFDWFVLGSAPVQVGFLIDNLTAVMLMVVTGVSALVHVYSTAYMHGDPKYSRYFAYLSLFSFSMLGLVLSDNLLFLYCFWELVGLSSYLLIGFWYERQAPAQAAMKAFLTNRVGDIGFFIGILMLWKHLGAFGYQEIFEAVAAGQATGTVPLLGLHPRWLTLAGLFLFCGAVGKSAQFPLHVWLPDAMEGPTPVSALIHAATMVAAGVYMVGRLFPLFTPTALVVIAYVGCFTALLAGTIALTATDIKRVLAYSTVSQLGYMIMGLGVGGYVAGLFHLMTHAWFKALLFLASGSVIHGAHTQEMPEMGGLRRKMPWTFATMLAGTLALSGVPFFSGFYSKDAILAAALSFGFEHPRHLGLFAVGVLGAGITTFYMFRLIFLTFFGEPRDPHKYEHAHESPRAMLLPLVILAVLSISSGWGHWFEELIVRPGAAPHQGSHAAHVLALVGSLLAIAIGFALSWRIYYTRSVPAEAVAARYPNAYRWLKNKYYVDEFYQASIVEPLLTLEDRLARFDLGVVDAIVDWWGRATVRVSAVMGRIDEGVVDDCVNWLADRVLDIGQDVRKLQMGRVQDYLVISFALTVIFILTCSLLS